MRSLRSRGVRRYGASRPPRGVRAEVLVKSSLGSWELKTADSGGGDRRVAKSRPSGSRGSAAPGPRGSTEPDAERRGSEQRGGADQESGRSSR